MASLYCPGSALIYAGVDDPAGVVPVYVGTGETPPDIDIKRAFTPIMNDLGGQSLPFDRMYDGEEAMASIVINRFNWDIAQQMQCVVDTIAGEPGFCNPGDIGSIMGAPTDSATRLTYDLWVVFPNSVLAAFPNLPPGYHFWSAFLIGPDKITTGNRDQKLHFMWQCQRQFVATTAQGRGKATVGSFVLYDTFKSSFANLPAIN